MLVIKRNKNNICKHVNKINETSSSANSRPHKNKFFCNIFSYVAKKQSLHHVLFQLNIPIPNKLSAWIFWLLYRQIAPDLTTLFILTTSLPTYFANLGISIDRFCLIPKSASSMAPQQTAFLREKYLCSKKKKFVWNFRACIHTKYRHCYLMNTVYKQLHASINNYT